MGLLQQASLVVTPNAYKAGKLYSIIPTDGSGDLTVTRATTATYVGSDGLIKTAGVNEVRFDYSNGSCPSILVEPQRTNLFLRSEEFNDVYWVKLGATISANAINSPNGTLTADRMVDNITTGPHYVEKQFVMSSGVNTLSIFCKKDNNRYIEVCAAPSILNAARFIFDFDTKTITSFGVIGTTITYVGSNITELQDGWFKLSLTFSIVSSITIYYSFSLSNSPNVGTTTVVSYTGDGTKGVFIWGAQLEAGSNATSYIPTTTSAVTRNADNIISTSNISSLVGLSEGSIYTEFMVNSETSNNTLNGGILSLRDSIGNNRILIRFNAATGQQLNFFVRSNTVDVINLNAGVLVPQANQRYKICVTYNQTGQKIFVNGVLLATRTGSFTAPTGITTAQIGGVLSGALISNINIFNSLVYTSSLTDAEAIQLTTL